MNYKTMTGNNMEELLELIKAKLEEKKAEDISVIDISELSIIPQRKSLISSVVVQAEAMQTRYMQWLISLKRSSLRKGLSLNI